MGKDLYRLDFIRLKELNGLHILLHQIGVKAAMEAALYGQQKSMKGMINNTNENNYERDVTRRHFKEI